MAEGSARILLVDDEHAVQKLLAMLGTRSPAGEPIVAGALEIDFDRRGVMVEDHGVRLTYVEFEILAALAADSGRVQTREMLLERVWGDSEYRDPRTIDVHIRHLREKIGAGARRPRSSRRSSVSCSTTP